MEPKDGPGLHCVDCDQARLKAVVRGTAGVLSDRLIAAVQGPLREDDLTVVVAQSA